MWSSADYAGADTTFKMQEILSDEIDDPEFLEFTVENFSEMMGYIVQGNLNTGFTKILLACPTVSLAGVMWS
jgi:hypothetical protein